MRVTSFRNCANADCNAHYPPQPYPRDLLPDRLQDLDGPFMTCPHCGTVWEEELRLDGQTCLIWRHGGGPTNWLESPARSDFILRKARKAISPRRLR